MKINYKAHDGLYIKRRALGYSGWCLDEAEYMELKEVFLEFRSAGYLPATGSVLEVGSGAGNLAIWLAELGYQTHGIDISPNAVNWAREKAKRLNLDVCFTVGNVVNMTSFQREHFDYIIDGYCLHCLIGVDRDLFLAECFRILKNLGKLLICTMCTNKNTLKLENYNPQSRCTVVKGIATRYLGQRENILDEFEKAGFFISKMRIEPDEFNDVLYAVIVKRKVDVS